MTTPSPTSSSGVSTATASFTASRELHGDDATESEAQLWPEHFDLATTIDEVNYGGSPGDDGHPLPYLYVGPWSLPDDGDPFWNEAFGASTTADASLTVEATVAFFESGRTRLPG